MQPLSNAVLFFQRKLRLTRGFPIIAALFLGILFSAGSRSAAEEKIEPAGTTDQAAEAGGKSPPDKNKLPFRVPGNPGELPATALIETSRGSFEIEFFRHEAPAAVRNFEYLAEKNYYRNVAFHRYVPGYLIQGGDPTGTGRGGPGYRLPPEFSKLKHLPGTVGMARLPDPVNPERLSNGSQFYIMFTAAPHLDGLYTVFARVIQGMDVVGKLRDGDTIRVVRLPRKR
jgi:cyclophilin family peptidyl-prolyl cis-trans isomerase